MTDPSPLRRKIGASRPDAPTAPSPERVWRRAVTHGIGRGLGLAVEVSEVTHTAILPDAVTDLMVDGMLVLLLDGPGAGGIAFLDSGPLAALIEQQTRGALGKRPVTPRTPTETDAALAADTLDRILATFDGMMAELGLGGTVTGYRFGTRITQPREIALALQDAAHDHWRMDIDFPQAKGRGGALQIVLPREPVPELTDQTPTGQWSEKIERRVMGADVALRAELARITLTADAMRAFTVGQVLSLPRTQIGQVTLMGPGDWPLAKGRLGQSAGRKALRIEAKPEEAFIDHTPHRIERASDHG